MYIGPNPSGPDAGAGLRIARVDHLTFDAGGPFHHVDHQYFRDLFHLFGLPWDDSQLSGTRNTFVDMAEVVVKHLGDTVTGVDSIVLANATPDAEAGYPIPYLAEALGATNAFAVSDLGAAAPFTALRLVSQTLAPGDRGRGLVVVMDQCAVLNGPPIPDDLRPSGDSAVLILLERDGALGRPRIRQRTAVRPAEVPALLAEALAGADTVICRARLERYLADLDGTVRHLPAPDGLPAGAVWSVLADLEQPQGPVVLADYDERLGYLSTCRLAGDGQ
ncbi:hypothetical protein OG943_24635 [Amycolatopsis sp. NBC_00345]|uniref:hypothetical protein n=1 Tax=Amycolatopsis sp. NBC_00345 TaxID=2975955 RepID=UPI002E26E076